ncbi:hypothetical protein ACQKLP_08535 [Chitinophaga sp. NPDC101104]|uniref:hypothetical protein n=1 Tax=Chitinophaga sp. NPDC101104 TaxID=3390561 RepID=UPI003D04F1AE
MNWKIYIAATLVLACVILLSSCYGTRKTLLFENRVYHWKVYFVKKRHLSVGTYAHFEVFYKGVQLVLPKEITGGKRAVGEFTSAVAVDNRSSQFGTLIVIFESDFQRDDGVPFRSFITLHIRPDGKKGLTVRNPCNGHEAQLEIAQVSPE